MLRPRGLHHHPSSSSSIPSPVEPSRLQPGYWLFSIVTYPWPPSWGMGFSLVAACGPLTAMLLLVQSTGPRAPGLRWSRHKGPGVGSRAPEQRLSRCGTQAWLLHSMWGLPGPGVKPVSPTLAGVLYHGAAREDPGCCFPTLDFSFFIV